MKVAVTVTGVFEVPAQPIAQITHAFRVANEALVGRKIETATGQLWTMVAIERLEVIDRDGPTPYECPFCDRISFNPHDIAHRYCGACHRYHDS